MMVAMKQLEKQREQYRVILGNLDHLLGLDSPQVPRYVIKRLKRLKLIFTETLQHIDEVHATLLKHQEVQALLQDYLDSLAPKPWYKRLAEWVTHRSRREAHEPSV